MDEVFGPSNFISSISVKKTSGATSEYLSGTVDHILFYSKSREQLKYRPLFNKRKIGEDGGTT